MDDPPFVCSLKPAAGMHGDVKELIEWRSIGLKRGHPRAQGLSFEQLHHDEGLPVVLLDCMNRADVRMIQRRSGPRLACETLQRTGIPAQFSRPKLHRTPPANL